MEEEIGGGAGHSSQTRRTSAAGIPGGCATAGAAHRSACRLREGVAATTREERGRRMGKGEASAPQRAGNGSGSGEGDGSSSAAAWQAAARSSSSNPLARACSGCQCPVSGSCAKRQRGGAHSASPGRPAALAAAGRRGRGVNTRPNHSWLRPKGGTGPTNPLPQIRHYSYI